VFSRILTLALVIGAVASAQPRQRGNEDAEHNLSVGVGDQNTISGEGVARYSEGLPGIADIRLTDNGDFVIVGLREGQTSLLLIYLDGHQVTYHIRVGGEAPGPGSIGDRENIRLDLYFVLLNEHYSHQIGLGFPGSIGGAGIGTANFVMDLTNLATRPFQQASLQLVNQVLPRLDLAQASGWLRLRRQAMVVTANGTSAMITNGGEVNIQIVGGISNTMRTIEFGSVLRVTPRYDSQSGRIEVQVQADISELADPYQPGGPPGRRRTQLQSLVNMLPGQAIVLAGAAARQESETQGGLPGLSQIPIVGVLFGTNQRHGDATEALLFIVPTVVQSVPRVDHDYIREALETFEHFTGHIHDIDMYGHEPPGYGRVGGTTNGAVDRSTAGAPAANP
jgi:Flp pilus assembly secretin CpaC